MFRGPYIDDVVFAYTLVQLWNVTTLIRRSRKFSFFAALYCSCLRFEALLVLQAKEGGNRGIKFKKVANNCPYETKIIAPKLMRVI